MLWCRLSRWSVKALRMVGSRPDAALIMLTAVLLNVQLPSPAKHNTVSGLCNMHALVHAKSHLVWSAFICVTSYAHTSGLCINTLWQKLAS